ncbi:MAG: 6-pyruvoyl tetrahydrobiopterin synthase [Ignavibacteria bacterium GWB2_35_6b]|nr:MAG: 6-pyruvoyl tetrahydrobiopterin synthase [Ignavibacteria bacterium GWB2_35_6b]
MIYVTRRETFSASHRLHNPKLSDEENVRVFGKCNNANGHGHNYVLEIIVAGEINPDTGYLIDLKVLKEIIIENVIRKVDHKNLNMDVDFLKDVIPSAENIAVGIWKQLVEKLPAGKLYSVKLYETENNYVEYKGE